MGSVGGPQQLEPVAQPLEQQPVDPGRLVSFLSQAEVTAWQDVGLATAGWAAVLQWAG